MEKIITTATQVDKIATQTGIKQKVINFLSQLISKLLPICIKQTEQGIDQIVTSIELHE